MHQYPLFYYETHIISHIIPSLLSISDRWYHDVWSSTGWDGDDNDGEGDDNDNSTRKDVTKPKKRTKKE